MDEEMKNEETTVSNDTKRKERNNVIAGVLIAWIVAAAVLLYVL